LDKDLIKGIENMKTRTQFASEPEQHELIENLKTATKKYVSQLDKEGIQTILLNGSIKRGDFCTQHLGGYVDLAVMIVSDEYEEIADALMHRLGRGVTYLHGKGAYTGDDKQVLYCVVTRLEVVKLKEIALEKDETAFVTINPVHDIVGGRFKKKSIH